MKYRDNRPQRDGRPGKINFRLIFMAFAGFCIFGLIGVKLVILQVVDHDYYEELARRNRNSKKTIAAQRGTIFDRQGRVLAKDIIQYSVAVKGDKTKNRQKLASQLSHDLGIPTGTILRDIKRNPDFAYIAHRVQAEKGEILTKINDPGLSLEKKFLRSYPYQGAGAHVIGFCNVDNEPMGGIEYQYDAYLRGKPGWKIFQRDALGKQLLDLDFTGEDPVNGYDVMLTLDMDYQVILEDELKNAVEDNKAEEGVAILMNPHTGELLGLANYPQFDPNSPGRFSGFSRKNRAVVDVFEPGSTFKIVVLSAALENLHLDLDKDIFFCENGRYNVYNQSIMDHKKYGWLTLRKVIENSSNIGTMKVAQQVKSDLLYRYVRNFGFGMVTGVDLPGESAGILHEPSSFSKITPLFMSIGYEIGVTPLQLVNAYAAIANGGTLLTPYMMKQVQGTNGRWLKENHKSVIRQVISPETTQLINGVLCGVVQEGTGSLAMLDGLTIAGKTGTAQIYDANSGKYDRSKHLASFVGYFPAEDPQFVLLVMVRQPKGPYYGGLVAAPAFRKMARRIMSIASVESSVLARSESLPESQIDNSIPRVEMTRVEEAVRKLEDRGVAVDVKGKGDYVYRQEEILKEGKIEKVRLYVDSSVPGKNFQMPSLKGLSLKEALDVLSNYSLVPSIEGHGIVVTQYPSAGTKIDMNKAVKLVCNPS